MEGLELATALSIFLLSTVKLFFAPGVAAASGLGLWETIALTTSGGVTGVSIFYFFGHWIFNQIDRLNLFQSKSSVKRKVFTKRNRLILKYRKTIGFYGLILLTPAILSIPIGALIAAKYYYHRSRTYPLLLISTIIWSTSLSFFAIFVKQSIL